MRETAEIVSSHHRKELKKQFNSQIAMLLSETNKYKSQNLQLFIWYIGKDEITFASYYGSRFDPTVGLC